MKQAEFPEMTAEAPTMTLQRDELRRIVADVLGIDPSMLETATDLTMIETFDSVNVLNLMFDLDEYAGIKLTPKDASQLHYFGDIEAVAERQGMLLVN